MRKTQSKSKKRSLCRVGFPGRDGCSTLGAADRFIPNRVALDYEMSHYKLISEVSQSIGVMKHLEHTSDHDMY